MVPDNSGWRYSGHWRRIEGMGARKRPSTYFILMDTHCSTPIYWYSLDDQTRGNLHSYDWIMEYIGASNLSLPLRTLSSTIKRYSRTIPPCWETSSPAA